MSALIDRAIKKYRSEGGVAFVFATVSFVVRHIRRRTTDRVLFFLWQRGLLDLSTIYTESYYQRMARGAAREDAAHFAELLMDRYDPDRVIDLGCGIGRFLEPFHVEGIEVTGVDGAQAAVEHAVVPKGRIEIHDLTEPYEPSEEADLVLCLEVLEHLPKEESRTVAASIAASAPRTVITTAPPGQGGRHHVNEQPMEFWISEFETVGMRFDEAETEYLLDHVDAKELRWLNHNIGVFERA